MPLADTIKSFFKNKISDLIGANQTPQKNGENLDPQLQDSKEQQQPTEIKTKYNRYVEASDIGLVTDSSVPF